MTDFNKNDKRDMTRRAIYLSLLFLVVIFVVVCIVRNFDSSAWFSARNNVDATGLQIVAATDGYELLIERSTEYDSLIAGVPKYDTVDMIKTQLGALGEGYDFTETSTAQASKLAYELQNEVAYSENDEDYYSLMPGSCGTLTFYLRPTDGDVTANFDLSLECYVNRYEGETLVTEKVENANVLNLLHGHILFFTDRRGNSVNEYKYNGLITDGTFSYDTSQNALCTEPGKTDCYKITLYWEWLLTYNDILNNTGNAAWAERYPPQLTTFVTDSPECFFASNRGSSDIDELNDGYNDGDQTIGENANYIVAFVTPG